MVVRISTSLRYVIDIIGTDPLSLVEAWGISSALARSVLLDVVGRGKFVGVSGTCTNWLYNSRSPDFTIWGLEGEEKLKQMRYF